ncbi:hypothetical protein K491DRAFT_434567 [Lophiostoma macrostomum CBS 122681]|uniref:L-ornithine N(5)-monooxygenase [NAD(P)H] n=1 Tax=Lophiostoma macrostomum CBS 122681 TaxID=1314788 RepID=A0A6A6T617_9PLEO|nr:hypothetical protein K491DRAFT_434567 [Lophiostoma macrostomum CBS 122681]
MASPDHESKSLNTRPTTPTGKESPGYELICIGFGPAQIATAIANRESPAPSKVLFLECKPSFAWYSSSHLPRTRMENAFVYDLATTRNPRSRYSYVNYLLSQKRLVEFANSDRLNPLRIEFEEYLRWCATQFEDQVRYGSEVLVVSPERKDDAVKSWSVKVRDNAGNTYSVRTRSIAAPAPKQQNGSKPRLLTNVDFLAGQRIISVDDYMSRRNDLRGLREPRLNVSLVGSSQQSVEILDDLLSCPRLGNVTVVTENETLAPLKILGAETAAPPPRLCSIWAKPSCEGKSTTSGSSEVVQSIYSRAYEKQVTSKGQYALRVAAGTDAAGPVTQSDIIIAEKPGTELSSNGLFDGLDALVLGCRQKGESLEEVLFKRGAVAEGCRMWMLSAKSEAGRSLAKDIAVRAGEIVKALATATDDGTMVINARM